MFCIRVFLPCVQLQTQHAIRLAQRTRHCFGDPVSGPTRFGRSCSASLQHGTTGSRTQLAVLLAVPTRQNTPLTGSPLLRKKMDRIFLT